jgi:hypothetical protein
MVLGNTVELYVAAYRHTLRRRVGVGSVVAQGRQSRAPTTGLGSLALRTAARVRGAGAAAAASKGRAKSRPVAVHTLGAASAAGLEARKRATEAQARVGRRAHPS